MVDAARPGTPRPPVLPAPQTVSTRAEVAATPAALRGSAVADGSTPAGLVRRGAAWLPGLACLAAAVASLRIPALIGFDPWVWLLWGREALHGIPANDGTVAWKPLPVLVTPILALFGDAAPGLWLVLSRALGLFGLVLVVRLAVRFAGPGTGAIPAVVAGAVAGAAYLLTPDAESRWVRHLLQGNVDPVVATLCLWAAERHLEGARGQALLLAGAAALARPEAWPLLGGYAVWLVWRGRRRWWQAAVVLLMVPVLWFGGDRLVSGSALGGAVTAQVLPGSVAERIPVVLHGAADVVILPVWIAALVGLVWAFAALHRGAGAASGRGIDAAAGRDIDVPAGGAVNVAAGREWAPIVLAAGALVWTAEVIVMAAGFGYAALGRFFAPVAAVVCVLAGLGVGRVAGSAGRLVGTAAGRPVGTAAGRPAEEAVGFVSGTGGEAGDDGDRPTRGGAGSQAPSARRVAAARLPVALVTVAVGAATVLAATPAAAPRLAWLPQQLAAAADRGRHQADLEALVAAAGRGVLLSCLVLEIDTARPAIELRPALAWQLGLPLAGVTHQLAPGYVGMTIAQLGSPLEALLLTVPRDQIHPVVRTERFVLYAQRCPG